MKKLLLALSIGFASVTSFHIGRGQVEVNVPPKAKADVCEYGPQVCCSPGASCSDAYIRRNCTYCGD